MMEDMANSKHSLFAASVKSKVDNVVAAVKLNEAVIPPHDREKLRDCVETISFFTNEQPFNRVSLMRMLAECDLIDAIILRYL